MLKRPSLAPPLPVTDLAGLHHASSQKQILGLDLLRFMAATLVMAYHFGFWHVATSGGALNGALSADVTEWSTRLSHFGWVGVEIFFVISGFVIAYSAQDATARSFLRGRFLRLVPAVWICAPLTLLISVLALHADLWGTLPNFLRSMTFFPMFGQIDGVYWTLGIEIAFYTVVLILLQRDRLDLLPRLALGAGIVSLLFWVGLEGAIWLLNEQGTSQDAWITLLRRCEASRIFQLLLLPHGCLFGLGIFIFLIATRGSSRGRIAGAIFLFLVCLIEIHAQNGIIVRASQRNLSAIPAELVFALFLLLFAGAIAFNRTLGAWIPASSASLRRAGLMTYPLYLIHNPVGLATILKLRLLGVPTPVALLGGVLAALVTAYVVSTIVEPALRAQMAKRVRRRGVAPAAHPAV